MLQVRLKVISVWNNMKGCKLSFSFLGELSLKRLPVEPEKSAKQTRLYEDKLALHD